MPCILLHHSQYCFYRGKLYSVGKIGILMEIFLQQNENSDAHCFLFAFVSNFYVSANIKLQYLSVQVLVFKNCVLVFLNWSTYITLQAYVTRGICVYGKVDVVCCCCAEYLDCAAASWWCQFLVLLSVFGAKGRLWIAWLCCLQTVPLGLCVLQRQSLSLK